MTLSPQDALLALNLIPGLGAMRIRALLDHFGSAELVLHAAPSLLEQVPRIGRKISNAISQWQSCADIAREYEAAARQDVRIVSIYDEEYPEGLRHMSDAPIILYVRGASLARVMERAVSIVGSRSCSAYGRQVAQQFARELSEQGCSIISGLALGIDAAAHQGALQAGGHTIGVIGSGHACFYPHENEQLALRMIEQGGSVVSEFPMQMRPSYTTFPQRNRIVAAWSHATLVVEAPHRSGSLHTARLASAEYGRHTFAVPGSINGLHSVGCHEIIRDGATLCASTQQLLADMRWDRPVEAVARDAVAPPTADLASMAAAYPDLLSQLRPTQSTEPSRPMLTAESQTIVDSISAGHCTLDALCVATGMAAHELNPLLMRLQIAGHIQSLPGAQYALR